MNKHHRKNGIDRRDFLHHAFYGAALAALTPGCLMSMREPGEKLHLRERYKAANGSGPAPLPPTRIYPPMPKAVVGIRGIGDSIEAAVLEAVEAAGGIDEIERGQTVMIKPNMCGPAVGDKIPGRITTNPEVIRAVIRMVKRRGAKVMLGDRSMLMTETAFRTSGFARVCRQEGAIAYPWTRAEYVRFYPKKRHWSHGFRFPKILAEVDHFISVPVLKNHQSTAAEYTCCLKAYVGVCLPLDRWQVGPDAFHTANISEKIAELNLCVKPTINIVDATEIMVRGGPDAMDKKTRLWAKPDLILASKDRVACDSVAMAVLKRYGAEHKVDLPYVTKSVWDQAQIYYSAELGIGQADPAMISIEDMKVPLIDEIKSNWV